MTAAAADYRVGHMFPIPARRVHVFDRGTSQGGTRYHFEVRDEREYTHVHKHLRVNRVYPSDRYRWEVWARSAGATHGWYLLAEYGEKDGVPYLADPKNVAWHAFAQNVTHPEEF